MSRSTWFVARWDQAGDLERVSGFCVSEAEGMSKLRWVRKKHRDALLIHRLCLWEAVPA
jgi:hypothetical protein